MSKRIFISGASSGIGEYLAYAYAGRGATIGLAARREELLNKVAQKSNELGGAAHVFQVDAKDQLACKSAAEEFMAQAGGIDMVIANAGIGCHQYAHAFHPCHERTKKRCPCECQFNCIFFANRIPWRLRRRESEYPPHG